MISIAGSCATQITPQLSSLHHNGTMSSLQSISDLTYIAVSASSKDNLRRVSKGGFHDFEAYALSKGGAEPNVVSPNTPKVVLNFLADITNLSKVEEHLRQQENGSSSADSRPKPKVMALDTLNGYV